MSNANAKIVYLPGADTNITVTRESRVYIRPRTRTRKPTWWQTFKRQATEDKITVTLEIVCICLLAAVVVAQAGILWNF